MGFCRPGQAVDSAPIFLIFFTKISKMEMVVDPKLISVIFKSEKNKKKKKRSSAYFHTFFFKGLHGFTLPYKLLLTYYLLTVCTNRPAHSCPLTLTSLWPRCAYWLVRFFLIPGQFQRPLNGALDTCPPCPPLRMPLNWSCYLGPELCELSNCMFRMSVTLKNLDF